MIPNYERVQNVTNQWSVRSLYVPIKSNNEQALDRPPAQRYCV